MYTRHFGLLAHPFRLTPDAAFLYLGSGHEEALAALRVGLLGRRGLIAMVGEVGTGKTTLLHVLLGDLEPTMRTAYVWNTLLPFDQLLREALADLGVPDAASPEAAMRALLERCAGDGTTATIVIDEAQNLDDEAFETLRLLSNFETHETKLLNVVLVGQPELEATLRRPHLRQVTERIAVRCRVAPLGWAESRRYVEHRLRRAGRDGALFTAPALRLLALAARGIPRRINILADTACLFAYGRGAARVRLRAVVAAMRERRALAAARDVPRVAPALAMALSLVVAGTWQLMARRPGPAPAAAGAPAVRRPAAAPPFGGRGASAERATSGTGASSGTAAPAAAAPADGAWVEVRVARGDTLNRIARTLYGRPLYEPDGSELRERIKRGNPQLTDVDRIRAGETLRVPAPTVVAGRSNGP